MIPPVFLLRGSHEAADWALRRQDHRRAFTKWRAATCKALMLAPGYQQLRLFQSAMLSLLLEALQIHDHWEHLGGSRCLLRLSLLALYLRHNCPSYRHFHVQCLPTDYIDHSAHKRHQLEAKVLHHCHHLRSCARRLRTRCGSTGMSRWRFSSGRRSHSAVSLARP